MVTEGRDTEIAQKIMIVETDMTIHWKALVEHIMMVPLVFQFNHFRIFQEEMHFLNFSQKTGRPQRVNTS
jgi:hypothetical protein